MKRLVLIALLLSGSAMSAHADNDIYNNILKQRRGDDALHADGAICDAEVGAPQNGQVTSRQYSAACSAMAGASATPSANARSPMTAIPTLTIPG